MTPEEAYEEALRRIRVAEETGALELNLSELKIDRLPPELERLTSLKLLDLTGCEHLSGDLSPLAGLTSLQWLNISGCWQLNGGLSPLASLTSLKLLILDRCYQLSGGLFPLASLTSLKLLILDRCNQLSDLSQLAGLTSLQSLDLWLCVRLRGDLSPLADLISLRSLNLPGCGLSGNLFPANQPQLAPIAQPRLPEWDRKRDDAGACFQGGGTMPEGSSRHSPDRLGERS